jgi:hypothetical protein
MLVTPMQRDRLQLQAASTYVLRRTVNHLRHEKQLRADERTIYAWHFMHQMLQETIRGHGGLTKLVMSSAATASKRPAERTADTRRVRQRS